MNLHHRPTLRPGLPCTKLEGSQLRTRPLRKCDKHGAITAPEGGVNINAHKWYCAACWAIFSKRTR